MSEQKQLDLRSLSDEALAVRAVGGCLDSYEVLVAKFQLPLLHYLRHRAKSREDAEDLVQEAFLRAFRNLHRYDKAWRFSTWLFTIAHRLAINAFRRDSRVQETNGAEGALLEAVSSLRGPAEQVAQADTAGRLWAIAAEELGEPKFTAVWLFYGEGLPVAHIADVLERTPGAIKTMLLRARRQLMPALRDQWQNYTNGDANKLASRSKDMNRCDSESTGV